MQSRYKVLGCPYTGIDGDYTLDTQNGSNMFSHINGEYFLYSPGPRLGWVIATNAGVYCKNTADSAAPQRDGWSYWKSNPGKYVYCSKMNVLVAVSPTPVRPTTADKQTPKSLNQASSGSPHSTYPLPPGTATSEAASNPPPVPHDPALLPPETLKLNEVDPFMGWEIRSVPGFMGSSNVFYNKNTKKQQSAVPDEVTRAQNGDGQVWSYMLPSINADGQIEVFAPANYAHSAKHNIHQRGYYQHFPEYATFWSHAVTVLVQEIRAHVQEIAKLKKQHDDFSKEIREIQLEISKKNKELEERVAREKETQAKSDAMLSRVGKSHIKRDWQQTRVGTGFPAGEDYRSMFIQKFLDFESFACDAVNCLEELQYADATASFVTEVMVPLFAVAVRHIQKRIDDFVALLRDEYGSELPVDGKDTITKLFWHSALQRKLFHEVMEIDQSAVMQIMLSLGGTVVKLYHEMIRQAKLNMIANDEHSIKLDKLLRYLLQSQMVAVLSDPPCFLQPGPGEFVSYKDSYCQEILSPGTKIHGRIKEGDQVQVVLPGLYFEDATGKHAAIKPVVSCLVRRLVNTGKK